MNLTWTSAQQYAAFARPEGSDSYGAFITIATSATPITIATNGANLIDPIGPELTALGFTKNTSVSPNTLTGVPQGAPVGSSPWNYQFGFQNVQNESGGHNYFAWEMVWPQFSVVFTNCTAMGTVYYGMQMTSPSLVGHGQCDFYIQTDSGDTKIKTLLGPLDGDTFNYDFSVYTGQTITLYAVYSYYTNDDPNQALLFQSNYTYTQPVPLFKASLSLAPTTSANTTNSCCTAVVGFEFDVVPSWQLNIPNGVTTENIEGTGQVDATLVYALYNAQTNAVITTQAYDITNFVTTPASVKFHYTPTAPGDYKLVAVLTTGCMSVTENLTINGCNYVTLAQDCHGATFSNLSTINTLTLTLYDSTGQVPVFTDTFPQTVPPLNAFDLQLTQDGTYLMKVVSSNADIFWFPVIDYCTMRECLAKLIKNIECGRVMHKCTSESDMRYLMNRIMALGQTYFSLLNGQYLFNNLYTSLQPSFLDDLFNINDIFTKLMKFCGSKCIDHDKPEHERPCGDCWDGNGVDPDHKNIRDNHHPKNDWDTQDNWQWR